MRILMAMAGCGFVLVLSSAPSVAAPPKCTPPCESNQYCVSFPPEPPHCEDELLEQFKMNKTFNVMIGGKAFRIVPQSKN
jgi:hypothetical protein